MTGQTEQPTPTTQELTPEQYQQLKPLLDFSHTTHLVPKPAQLRRQEKKDKAIEALRKHGTLLAAAKLSGVSRSTLYRWREEDPAFEAQVKEWLDEDMEAELHDSMFRIATSEDPRLANAAVRAGEILLKSINPTKYGDKLQVDSTTNINHKVTVIHEQRDHLRTLQAQRIQELRTLDAQPLRHLSETDTENA